MAEAMGTSSSTTYDKNMGCNFDISSQIRQNFYICADGVEDYTVKVLLTDNHRSNTVSFVRMKVTSESIPGLDLTYQTCTMGDIITGRLDDVNKLAALSRLLFHIQFFCQEYGIKHLTAEKQKNAFETTVLSLAGFKGCTCRLPGQVNDGSRLCLPFAEKQAKEEERSKGLRGAGISRLRDFDKTALPSDFSHEQTAAEDTYSAGQVIDHTRVLQTLEKGQSEPMSATKAEHANSYIALVPISSSPGQTATKGTQSTESQFTTQANIEYIQLGSRLSQPKQLPAPKSSSESQSTTQQADVQVLDEARISQPVPVPTPKDHDPHSRSASDEMKVTTSYSLATDPSPGSSTVKNGPWMATLLQSPLTDNAQARIDEIIQGANLGRPQSRDLDERSNTPGKKKYCSYYLRTGKCDFLQTGCKYLHNYPDDAVNRPNRIHTANANLDAANPIRTPGTLGKKEYCAHYLRTGKCDFMQTGCRYKHELPQNEETQRKLSHTPYFHLQVPQAPGVLGQKEYCTSYLRSGMCDYIQIGCRFKHEYPEDVETRRALKLPGLPRWRREERDVQAPLDRNQAVLDGQNAVNDGVTGVTELSEPATGDHLLTYEERCRTKNLDPAGRKRSYLGPGSDSDDTATNGDAVGRSSYVRHFRNGKSSGYIDRYVPQYRDREHPAQSSQNESSSNTSHITSQHGDMMLGRYPIKTLDTRYAPKRQRLAENDTSKGHGPRAPSNRKGSGVKKGTIAFGRG